MYVSLPRKKKTSLFKVDKGSSDIFLESERQKGN